MVRMAVWDLLLVGLLASPVGVGSLFLYTMWGLLTVEIVPADQGSIPVPGPGDMVEVYGTWVRDSGHLLGDFGWNEIHPAVFLRNLDSGEEGGTLQCKLLENVHDPERLKIMDPSEPCQWARGKVQFVFYFGDGDLHVDLRLEPQYQFLANSGAPVVAISYPTAQLLVASEVLGFGLSYVGVSVFRPQKTILGQVVLRLRSRE